MTFVRGAAFSSSSFLASASFCCTVTMNEKANVTKELNAKHRKVLLFLLKFDNLSCIGPLFSKWENFHQPASFSYKFLWILDCRFRNWISVLVYISPFCFSIWLLREMEKWEDCGIVEFCEWLEFRLALIRFVYFNLDFCKWNVIVEVLDLVRFDLELWAMIGFIWICIDSDDSFCWCYIFYTSFANVCEICILGFWFFIF